MSCDIEIKGLKELQRELERMKEGLTLSKVNQWCKRIEAQAKQNCPEEHRESINIDAVQAGPGRFDIQLKAQKEALPHVRTAIKSNLSSMPITTRALFETVLKNIEQKI